MSILSTGSLSFSWVNPSFSFDDLRVDVFKNNNYTESRYQTGNSIAISGLNEGDSINLQITPSQGGALFLADIISTPTQIVPVTNFHPPHPTGKTFEISTVDFNGENLPVEKNSDGIYSATGIYNTNDLNVDLGVINPRNQQIISYIGEEPFLSGTRFFNVLSGVNYSTGFANQGFAFSTTNNTSQRNFDLKFVVEDIYGSGVTGNIFLKNTPPEIYSLNSSFQESSPPYPELLNISFFPDSSFSTNSIDYFVYENSNHTGNIIFSGQSFNTSSITGLFPINKTGYIKLIPSDFFGTGKTFLDTRPIFPNLSQPNTFDSIASHSAQGEETIIIDAIIEQNNESGYYTELSIDSSKNSSFNGDSYFTGLFENIFSGYSFDTFSNRTGVHEEFYYNLKLFQSGTNLLQDSASGSFIQPIPKFTQSNINYDYKNGITTLAFTSVPPFSHTGVNVLFSGKNFNSFKNYSGYEYATGSISCDARARLVRSYDNYVFDEISISGSGINSSLFLSDISFPSIEGSINTLVKNPNPAVIVDKISVFRKPSLNITGGAVTSAISGILEFNDYLNYPYEDTVIGHYIDLPPNNVSRNLSYTVTGLAITGYNTMGAVTGVYQSGRHYSYRFVPVNGYGSGDVSDVFISAFGGNAISQAVGNDLGTAEVNISTSQDDIAVAKSDISTAQSDISNAQSDISNAQSDISNAQSDISTAQSNISNLQTQSVFINGSQSITGDKTFKNLYVTGQLSVTQDLYITGDVYSTGTFLYNNLPPTTSSSFGKSGQMAFDHQYLYVCTGENSWGRIEFTDSSW